MIDIEQARQHVALIAGSADAPVTFQIFDDTPEKNPTKARIYHGTLADCWDRLVSASADGRGIFLAINETDGQGRKAENVTRVRALFIDGDGIDMPAFKLAPTFTAARGPKNWHAYWIVSDGDRGAFRDDQTRLIACYDSDKSIKDLPRVMRLAGFPHQKDPAHPSIYSITVVSGLTYTRAQVLDAHAAPKQDPEDLFNHSEELEEQPKEHSEEPAKELNEKRIVWEYIRKIESIQTQHGNDGMMRVCRALITGFGLDRGIAWKALGRWNREIAKPSWSMNELARAMASVERTRSKIPVGCLWENIDTEIPSEDDAKPRMALRFHEDRLRDRMQPAPELVAGLLPVGGIGVIVAQPGVGKTLIAVSMAGGVAVGGTFAGRVCQRGRVIYCCPDSPASTERRMLALDAAAAGAIATVCDFRLDEDGAEALAATIVAERESGRPVALLIIDTWDSAREHSGSAWNAEDAAVEAAMRILRRLAESEGMCVLLVHHATRADGGRARGSSVLDARVEMIGIAEAADDGTVSLRTTKVRDGEKGEVGRAKIVPVELPFGKPVATLEWMSATEAAADAAQAKRSASALDLLRLVCRSEGHNTESLMAALAIKSKRAFGALVDSLRSNGWMERKGYQPTAAGRNKNDQENGFGDDSYGHPQQPFPDPPGDEGGDEHPQGWGKMGKAAKTQHPHGDDVGDGAHSSPHPHTHMGGGDGDGDEAVVGDINDAFAEAAADDRESVIGAFG